MFTLRTHAIILASFFGALLIIGWGGAILQGTGAIRDAGALRWPMLILMGALVFGLAFSAIPVIVMLVLGLQKQVGNEQVAAVAAAIKRRNSIIHMLWALMALGSVIAIPAAILGGAFDTRSLSDPLASGQHTDIGASQGMLIAKPGMTLDEMKQASSLAINAVGQRTTTGAITSGIVFDFKVAGTDTTFERCRYYFVSTFTNDPQHIQSLSIGTSTFKQSHAALNETNADLRRKLAADGWLAGHEEYKTEEDQTLHGGATHGPEGDLWLKDGTLLHLEIKRMDDTLPGEDPNTAGEWVQTVTLWGPKDYPWIERYAFAVPSQ